MVAGVFPISWLKLFSFIMFTRWTLFSFQDRCYIWNLLGMNEHRDSSSPARIWRAHHFSNMLLARISFSESFLPVMCSSPQFSDLYSFGHLWILSLVWWSSLPIQQTALRLYLVFMCPYLWQLWHIMRRSWYLYTALSDGCPGIQRVCDCYCRLKVRSTAVVLEFLDLMKLASFAFSNNG